MKPLVLFGYRIRVRAWLRDVRVAFRTLVGQTAGDRRLLEYISNSADLGPALAELRSDMPQAVIIDERVTLWDNIPVDEARQRFAAKLSGQGLEMGALHRPLKPHPGMQMTYLDRADQATLKATFPEVADSIMPVDIIDDAETMRSIHDGRFDFVVAGHVIEHTRNPIGAIATWLRVVRPAGLIYLIVPDKRKTFDRARVRTTLEHVIFDYLEPSRDRDLEHFLDYARFVHGKQGEDAVALARQLVAEDYSIHFHTFIPTDVAAMVEWMNDKVTPVTIFEGPILTPESSEFHLLLRRG